MAKYVLLAFDDNDDADTFAALLMDDEKRNPETVSLKVVGIFQKPTVFCDCTPQSEKSVRGSKHGWRVHKECGKPKRGLWQSPDNKLQPDVKHHNQTVQVLTVEGSDKPRYLTATFHA